PFFLEFVADAESLDIRSDEDLNEDELRNDMLAPGHIFYDHDAQSEQGTFPQVTEWQTVFADAKPYKDPWGVWIGGAAPIFSADGEMVGILGVDIDASEIQALTNQTFVLVYYFLGFFLLFVFIRLAAFRRSLLQEIWQLINTKAVLLSLAVIALLALLITFGMYRYTLGIMKEQVGERLMSIAATAAPEIDARDLEVLHKAEDMEKEEYQRVFEKLNEIKDNADIGYVYVLRPTENINVWEWVVDADSNYFIPNDGIDYNGDGVIDEADEGVAPGISYDATGRLFATESLKRPMVEDFATDQWGTFLTGFTPIFNEEGVAVAVLGLDINVSDFLEIIHSKFQFYFWFFGSFLALLAIFVTFRYFYLYRSSVI
ncbi:hypothetical protein KKA50_02165, partial [Patescibacteria group bacterium]|nr:hypothetical protein [Patescibacteria group bacterium]